MNAFLLSAAFACLATAASAHGSPVDDLTSDGAWTSDLSVIAPLYVTALLYFFGTRRLWRRAGHGKGVRHWQAFSFWLGWIVLALALLSPLHWLSEHLFAAHMAEHELIMLVAAPLLVFAHPVPAFLWGMPLQWRRSFGGLAHRSWFAASWRWATRQDVSTGLHAAAIWGWHIPAAFNAALTHAALHWAQHLSFLATALLFWRSILSRGESRLGSGIFWLFLTAMHTSALGVLLTLSRTPWIPLQSDIAAGWGLSPLEDQQLAGLIMWVPAGMVYTGVALWLAWTWIGSSVHHKKLGSANA